MHLEQRANLAGIVAQQKAQAALYRCIKEVWKHQDITPEELTMLCVAVPMHDLLLKRAGGDVAMSDADLQRKGKQLYHPAFPDPLRNLSAFAISFTLIKAQTYERCTQAETSTQA